MIREFMVFTKDGKKEKRTAMNKKMIAVWLDEDVDFITEIGVDMPWDYDWDERLEKWQARIF